MNVMLFGIRVFTDVIKIKWSHTGLGCASNPITSVKKTKTKKKETNAQGRQPCEYRRDTGIMLLQCGEGLGLPSITGS